MRKQTTDNLTYFLECQEQRMYREERDRDKVNGYTDPACFARKLIFDFNVTISY